MQLAEETRPGRPQRGVRYGLEGWSPTRPDRHGHRRAPRSASAPAAVRPRSAAALFESAAPPWFYSRSAGALWLGVGVITAFTSTSVGAVLLIGHELRRGVAAAFVVGLLETAGSLSLALALWGRETGAAKPVLLGSIALGAFLVVSGIAAPPWGVVVAILAAVAAVFSLVVLRDQIRLGRREQYDEIYEEEGASP